MAVESTVDGLIHVGPGERVSLLGWVDTVRDAGGMAFVVLRDGTGEVQVVVRPETGGFDRVAGLTIETAVRVVGSTREDKRAPGGMEIQAEEISVEAPSDPDYPLQKKAHSTGFLMDHRHLWIRRPAQRAVLRVRSTVMLAAQSFLEGQGYARVDAPVLTPNACEGTTTLFPVEYFGEEAYLTQSGQLYNEAAALALGRVYCFGPCFRAEKSKTRRHLTEFWMLEPEAVGLDLDRNMRLQERLVIAVLEAVLDRNRSDLEALGRDLSRLTAVCRPFPRVSYGEAVERLNGLGHATVWGEEMTTEEEEALADDVGHPYFLHRFPAAWKAFYMARDPEDDRLALAVDMFMPEGGGEVTGGGTREPDADLIAKRIAEAGLPREEFGWYHDLRRYGGVTTGGFGLGVERLVRWITGIHHVRETIPFPRTIERLRP